MRIVLFGQAAFGAETLRVLIERGEEIVGVYTPPDVAGKPDPLKQGALEHNIPVFQPERMRAKEVFDAYAKLAPDLNVLAFVTDILPESILHYPEFESIQYHPSLLPKHRGGSSINWAVINGETKTGVTIFWPDKGIDTGPVLLQKEARISPEDTVGSLYFDKLFPLGIRAIPESIELIEKGTAPRIPQDESLATYEGWCTAKDAVIDWAEPAQRVFNLIRGTNPQPGARTSFRGAELKVFDSTLLPGKTGGVPGEVIEAGEDGFAAACPDGAILIKRVQPGGSPKIAAAAFISQTGLKPGERLGE